MDQSSFHFSWLALGARYKGCFPFFRHVCDELAISVSPINAALCSCQPAAFEVRLRQVDTKTASNQWCFRFQPILFDHTDPLRGFQDHTDAHELMQNWQRLHFTGPQLKASLPLEDLCIFLWWGYCNVNLGIVEAGAPPPAETRNCGLRKPVEHFHTENVLFWAPGLPLIFQMVGRGKSKLRTWALDDGFDSQTGLKRYI